MVAPVFAAADRWRSARGNPIMKSLLSRIVLAATAGLIALPWMPTTHAQSTLRKSKTDSEPPRLAIHDPKTIKGNKLFATVGFAPGSKLVLTTPSGTHRLMVFNQDPPPGNPPILPIEVTRTEKGLLISYSLKLWGEQGSVSNTYPLLKNGEALEFMEKPVSEGGKCLFAVIRRPDGTTETIGLNVVPENEPVAHAEQRDAADSR
jgi:hypothetical protein